MPTNVPNKLDMVVYSASMAMDCGEGKEGIHKAVQTGILAQRGD